MLFGKRLSLKFIMGKTFVNFQRNKLSMPQMHACLHTRISLGRSSSWNNISPPCKPLLAHWQLTAQ